MLPCLGLGIVATLALTWAATAAPPKQVSGNPYRKTPSTHPAETPATHEPASIEPETRVKMNYIHTSWKKVLEDLAEATHTQLVADKLPKKTYSRNDWRAYTVAEALRIINNEIEPQGFRAMFKGQFLVVIDLPTARVDYPRAVIPAEGTKPAGKPDGRVEQTGGNLIEIPTPKATTKTTPIRTRQNPRAQETNTARNDQVAWQIPQGEETQAIETSRPQPVEDEEMSLTPIRLKKRDAVSISRIIYRAFKAQAEMIDDGPQGLQGFRVFAPTQADGKVDANAPRIQRFAVGIDEERNILVVEAGARETRAVSNLIRSLDTLPNAQQPMIRAVTTTKDAGHIAAALQPELDRLSAEGKKLQRRNPNNFDDDPAEADDRPRTTRQLAQQPPEQGRAQPRNAPQENVQQPGGGQDLQSIIGSLKSDVTVEAVPDLGVMILRGNQQDVEAVMEIIRQIEKLSAGTVPDVQLVPLKHVNSESMATLITSLYERLAGGGRPRVGGAQATSSVSVIPVVRPNAVLVVAGAADMDKVLSLIDNLDQPGEPSAEFKVFNLKYAVPDQVVAAITALYPAPTTGGGQQTSAGLTARVRSYADVRTNAVIVQARPTDMREVTLLIHKMDVDKAGSTTKLRIFPLTNAMADELSVTLQTAIQAVLAPARVTTTTGQGGQQIGGQAAGAQGAGTMTELRDVRSTILELMGDKNIRSGILADIRISADSRTNSLVVTAPEQSMTLMAELIKQLDKPAAAVAEIKVFHLENGDATATAALLQTLFTGQQQGQGGQNRGQLGNQNQAIGFQIAGEDATSTLIPVRFSVDVRTNNIIGIGGAEALRVAEAIIYRLDESDIRQRQTVVYRLKNSPALDVANAIALFLQSQQQVIQQDPAFLSPFEQFEREVVVVPEPVNNALLISATPRYFKDIMDVVKELDAPPKQVLIQALVVEVTLDNTDEWGVELGIQDSILFNRSLVEQTPITISTTQTGLNGVTTTSQQIVGQTANPGFNFNNNPLGNNTATTINSGNLAGQALSNFTLARVNGDLGYGGLVLSAGSESLSVLLRALAARRRVDVLSRPQIRTLDNQQAEIFVGQFIQITSNVNTNAQTGFSTPVVTPRQVGIRLVVRPRINSEGVVVMEVSAAKEALNPRGLPLITNPNGTTIDSPIIDSTTAITAVSVKSGQTAVIGGMITKTDDNSSRKVPVLGDIPYVGPLFRYDSQRVRRTELLIFLTPRVVTSDEESEMVKQIEIERMNFIQEEAIEMHGPLMGVPGATDWIRPGAAPGEVYYQPQSPNAKPQVTLPDDDPNVPTTLMRGEPNQIPPVPQDWGNQLQGNRRPVRDGAVVPTDYRVEEDDPSLPGRSRLTGEPPAGRPTTTPAAQSPRAKGTGPVLNTKPLKRSTPSKNSK